MNKTPFFSVIVAVKNEEALLEETLISILHQKGSLVEAIVIDVGNDSRYQRIAQNFPIVTKVSSMMSYHRYRMYNRGMKFAKGDYLFFFAPGDVFLSQYTLQQLHELISKTHMPDVVLGSGLLLDLYDGKRKVVGPISLKKLRRGKMPINFCAIAFKKEKILHLKGFNPFYRVRGGYELLCRLYSQVSLRFVTTQRVISDHKFIIPTIDNYVGYNLETPRVVYKYFGWKQLFFYLCTHNYFLFFKYWMSKIRFTER